MGVFDFFGSRSVVEVRTEYDRLREHVDREHNMSKRMEMLHILDQIEPMIIILEEQFVENYEKRRIISRVEEGIKRVKTMFADKDYMQPLMESREGVKK